MRRLQLKHGASSHCLALLGLPPPPQGQEADSQPQQQRGAGAPSQAPAQPATAATQRPSIWRGLHGKQQSHAQQGLSGGTAASSRGSGGGGMRGADSCPSALLRGAGGLGLSSPRQQEAQGSGGPAAAATSAAAPPAAGASRLLAVDRTRPVRAAVGVRMAWVSAEHRRRGVASKLLDAARSNMVPCYVAPRAQVAFTQPTEAGAALAAAYVGPQGWLLYGA
jgi:hypothetical protein